MLWKLPRCLLFVAMLVAFAFAACQFRIEIRPVDSAPPSNACFADGCDCRPNCFCAECECCR